MGLKVKEGNLEEIKKILTHDNKNDILCATCQYGHLEIVKYLIEKCGADARAENDFAVQEACANGHLEIVKYLIEKCDANVHNEDECAIMWACEGGHHEVVKYLI